MANDTKLVNLADLKEAFDNLNNNKKNIQAEVNSPTASGTAAAFIDTISQNAQGVITATKKSVTPASIGAARYINLTATTAATIYPVLNVLDTGQAAVIHMSADAFKALTINKPNNGGTRSILYAAVSGIVYRSIDSVFAFDISRNNGIRRWAFQSTITSSTIQTDNVYTYSGTEVT